MYTKQSKKLLIIDILDILRKYTDENHRLSQKEIEQKLKTEYMMPADRKSIKRNLENLIDFGYDISCTEIQREGKNGEETICTDWYLERDFSDAELRLLIDSLLFSKHIPHKQCKDLIEKLKSLSNKYFSARVKHVCNLPENMPANKQLFLSIEVLDEAIDRQRKVQFSFGEYSHTKELVFRKTDEGKDVRYIFNPYQMAATNGKYYLIGNFDRYDNVAYVRIDHLSDVKILEEKAKAKKEVKGLENGLDLPKTMAEHIYMMHGDTVNVKFRAPKSISDQIVDWFGFDFTVLEEKGDDIIVSVKVNKRAMRFWALQYGNFVEVLEPKELRENIKDSIRNMIGNYKVDMTD